MKIWKQMTFIVILAILAIIIACSPKKEAQQQTQNETTAAQTQTQMEIDTTTSHIIVPQSIFDVEFKGETIPITVFYSSKDSYGSNLDKVVFNYNDIMHTINLNGMEFDNEMDSGSISINDYNFNG